MSHINDSILGLKSLGRKRENEYYETNSPRRTLERAQLNKRSFRNVLPKSALLNFTSSISGEITFHLNFGRYFGKVVNIFTLQT